MIYGKRDLNQLAKHALDIATAKIDNLSKKNLIKQGVKVALLGGKARAENLSPGKAQRDFTKGSCEKVGERIVIKQER